MGLFSKTKDPSGHFSNKTSRKKGAPILHLRIDHQGLGLLMFNGSRTIWLNETAAEYVKHALLGTPENKAVGQLRRRFAVSKALARRDLKQVKKTLERVSSSPKKDPLELFKLSPGSMGEKNLESPLHMYVHITYNDPDRSRMDTVPPDRSIRPLSRREWEVVLERTEGAGVHYITLCGGEPTAREDLDFFVRKASALGMAVGLETNGVKLADQKYLDTLINAGLDGVTIKFPVSDPRVYKKLTPTKKKGFYKDVVQGIRNALASGLETHAFVLLSKETVPHLHDTVKFLSKLGVKTVMLGLLPQSNPDVFLESSIGREHIGALIKLVESLGSASTEVLLKTPLGAGQASSTLVDCTGAYTNMALEPNGDVLICRYMFSPLGNIITDPWGKIWDHPNAAKVRNREDLPSQCGDCPDLVLCGGGCPEWVFFIEETIEKDYVAIEVNRKRR